MARYKFYQDVERISKEREYYFIEANSLEEAIERVALINDLGDSHYDDFVRWEDTETIDEKYKVLDICSIE